MRSPTTAEHWLAELEARDIQLTVSDGKLRCNAPKGAITSELRAAIKQHKPALICLLADRVTRPDDKLGCSLSRIDRAGDIPLSFSQERIWLLSQLDPVHYVTGNIHFTFRITGALDVSALEQALNELIQRHEVFRIRCENHQHRPVQSIVPDLYFHLPVRDLREQPSTETEATIRTIAEQYALAPFDLSVAPILRAGLLRVADDDYRFLFVTHLYLFDGWSTALLLKELSSLYTACRAGVASGLAPLQAQYADFAHWHRCWFGKEEAAKQHVYWCNKLRDTRLVTELPCDHPRQLQQSVNSASVPFSLPDLLADAIRNLSQRAGTTLFISLMAAFQSLLYSYTRQDRLATGTIVSNRRLAETESMIGSFANTILIASDFSSGTTFLELLEQIRQSSREAYAHQDIPFERLLGGLNKDLTHNPMFRVMFVLHQHQSQADRGDGLALTGLQVQKLPDVRTLSRYDLELVMVDRDNSLSGLFVYNADMFDYVTIERMQAHFFQVLRRVTDQPDLSLSELPVWQTERCHDSVAAEPVQNRHDVALRTPTESVMTQLWQDILHVEHIGIHDSFIALGGHSLLAIRLITEIKSQFDLDIELADMYMFPTISMLAMDIDRRNKVGKQM